MTEIKLKPCPFCGGAVNIGIGPYKGTIKLEEILTEVNCDG